jgi:hypothetical protein
VPLAGPLSSLSTTPIADPAALQIATPGDGRLGRILPLVELHGNVRFRRILLKNGMVNAV